MEPKNTDSVVVVENDVELGVTEATGVVPGLHLPTPKRKGSKKKKHISNERFVEIFQSAETAEDACRQLAMPDENGVMVNMTLNNLYLRAKKLRGLGVPLSDGFSRKPLDVTALTALAKKFAKPVEGETVAEPVAETEQAS